MQLSMRFSPGQEDGDKGDEVTGQWELVVEAAFIECGSVLKYANISAAGGPCQVLVKPYPIVSYPIRSHPARFNLP